MITLGKKQKLVIAKELDFGVYLGEEENAKMGERVLLPAKQVPKGAGRGDEIEVFIYKDSSDRLIATTRTPALQLGELALLPVAQVGKIGAFLKWGLEKDLLLPYREQKGKVREGDAVLVALYVDKSDRLCATMRVYPYLKQNSPYVLGDEVTGRVYDISDNFGVFVAVDNCYSGLIPKKEAQGTYVIGQELKCRVTEVKEDGKLNLSSRKKAYLQMEDDGQQILEELEKRGGLLPFDDKASPELIKETFGMSKAAFKRAVGHLMKEKKIALANGKIEAR